MRLNIYLVSQQDVSGVDTYDSFVCVTDTIKSARHMHPCEYVDDPIHTAAALAAGRSWTTDPKKVSVTFIGHAAETEPEGIVCASFNAV